MKLNKNIVKEQIQKVGGNVKNAAITVGEIATDAGGKALDAVKEKADEIGVQVDKAKINANIKKFAPLSYVEYCKMTEHNLVPKIVQMEATNNNKNIPGCENAVAYLPIINGEKVLKVIKGKGKTLNLIFYPNENGTLYYENPYIERMYVDIEEYFNYIRKQRISELEMIANKLGATEITIEEKEEKKSLINKEGNTKATKKIKKKNGVKADVKTDSKEYSNVEIVCHNEFSGADPIRPKLVYYKDDPDMKNLIELRMGSNPCKLREYELKFISNKDLNLKGALSIDAVIKGLKLAGNVSMQSEVEKQERKSFKYIIKF